MITRIDAVQAAYLPGSVTGAPRHGPRQAPPGAAATGAAATGAATAADPAAVFDFLPVPGRAVPAALLGDLIARMGGAAQRSGAGWFVDERV